MLNYSPKHLYIIVNIVNTKMGIQCVFILVDKTENNMYYCFMYWHMKLHGYVHTNAFLHLDDYLTSLFVLIV